MEIGAVVNAVGTVVGVEEEDSVPFDGVVLLDNSKKNYNNFKS